MIKKGLSLEEAFKALNGRMAVKESVGTDLSKLKVKDLKTKTIDLTELGFGYVNYLGIYRGYVVCTYDDDPWARKLDAETLEQSVLEIASWSQGELTEEDIQDIKIINQPISDIIKVKKLIDIIKNQTDLRENVKEPYFKDIKKLEQMYDCTFSISDNAIEGYRGHTTLFFKEFNNEEELKDIIKKLLNEEVEYGDGEEFDEDSFELKESAVTKDVKIKKFLVDDYIKLSGAEPGDYDFNNLKAKFIYTDEKEESAQVGIEFKNGKFAVVGLNNDHMCDDYKHMVQCIKSYM